MDLAEQKLKGSPGIQSKQEAEGQEMWALNPKLVKLQGTRQMHIIPCDFGDD